MAYNRFVLNATSYHGKGAIQVIPDIIRSKGFNKAFVASDPDLVKFGVTAKVTDLLAENGIDFELYTNIKPTPTIENVQAGVEAYQKSGADFMISIGGGSSMDTGKAIGIIVNNPEYADVRSLEGVAPTKNRTVFTIAVPTTGGTGAGLRQSTPSSPQSSAPVSSAAQSILAAASRHSASADARSEVHGSNHRRDQPSRPPLPRGYMMPERTW